MNNAVIILAAGQGRRMGLEKNKILLPLKGKPILFHSLKTFSQLQNDLINTIVVVAHKDEIGEIEKITKDFIEEKTILITKGGKSRQESVFNGLLALEDLKPKKVLIHDGARPFVTQEIIERVLNVIDNGVAVTSAIPMIDSLRQVDKDLNIVATVDRDTIYAVQTPQGFMYEDLLIKHKDISKAMITDDAQLFQKQIIVAGDSKNIKITTQGDYSMVVNSLERSIRVGQGFDVHRLVEGRELILGGVKIPFAKGLLGHSDADVLLHAIIDALLGACGLGDIGEHFPDSDERYSGVSSRELLLKVKELLLQKGATIENIDAYVLAEAPKITPYKKQIRKNVANDLKVLEEKVNIKASTTERLGFIGREEGIAAMAIVTIKV